MTRAVLFDLGNTLVSYYKRHEFRGILEEAIDGCLTYLQSRGIGFRSEGLWDRVKENDNGSPDNRVRPLRARLAAIFGLDDEATIDELSRAFMKPIFDRGRLHSDVKPTLRTLRGIGLKTAIVSNTPWGSPPNLWRQELDRISLTKLVDETVFCGDVGWRKPDPRIFLHALNLLGVEAVDAVFVGDDPRWDVKGPATLGMRTVLVDRTRSSPDALHTLKGLMRLL